MYTCSHMCFCESLGADRLFVECIYVHFMPMVLVTFWAYGPFVCGQIGHHTR